MARDDKMIRRVESDVASPARLEMLTRQIIERKGQVGRGLYEIGIRLAHIDDERMWCAGDYTSFEDYLERAVQFSRSTAYRLIRIARTFDAPVVARHGVEKLELAVRYLNASKSDVAARPMDTPVRVRDARGRFVTRTLEDASASEIRDALNDVRGEREVRPVMTAALKRKLKELAESLPPAPAGTHRGERIRLRRGRDGELAVTFHAVPMAGLEEFAELLARFAGRNGDER